MLLWLLLLNGLFLLPALSLPGAMPWLSIEALALWSLLCLLPGTRHRLFTAVAAAYSLIALLVLVDALMRQSLGRGLNLYLEFGLLEAGWHLLTTNLGTVLAVLALLLLVAALAGVAWLLRLSLRRLGHHSPNHLGPALLLVTGLAIAGSVTPLIGSPALAFVTNQASLAVQTHRTAARFASQLAQQSELARQPQALSGLAGTDVILGFLESYGVSTLTDPRYRPVISERLDAMAAELGAAGLTVVTGRLQSPIQGGQSWLGHLSVLSGQWVPNQLAYETLLSQGYPTLIDDFRHTGHRTLAVMPAITQAWPEGRLLRYDDIYAYRDLGYQGPAFNWVTMPDQYTWQAFQGVRTRTPGPVFAELALISSHAPWVPVLPVLADWQTIGDGRVFERWRGAGEAPVSLWQEPDRVRDHYARAVAYTLAVASGFAARYVDSNTLLILLGDHQPAPLITGENASRDVIVHVISGNPDLLAPFRSGHLPGFQPGTRPDLATPGAPMDRFRPFLHRHFGAR